jgi:dihydrofolate synthase/folylpolyglutamate synthase
MTEIKTLEDAEKALLPFVPLVGILTGLDTTFDRVRPLVQLLGHPEDQLKVIHIAGTSGKTSTAYYMSSLIVSSGHKVGLLISPYVDRLTERIQINGKSISDKQFCADLEHFLKIVKKSPNTPSYFELLYVMALWIFAREQVDYAVIETGVGGLLDATNIVTRADKVCIITDIGFDHTDILGHTLAAVTHQKIGIAHEHNPVFMYQQSETIMNEVSAWTTKKSASLNVVDETREKVAINVDMSAMPAYQQRNWLLAYRVYRFLEKRDNLLELSPENLKESRGTIIPARMEIKRVGAKTIVMDGAHNEQKMTALVRSFQQLYPEVRPAILIALKKGKNYQKIVQILSPLASSVIVTIFNSTRDLPVKALDPEQLAEAFRSFTMVPVQVVNDQAKALQTLLARSNVTIITGSFYLLSQLRSHVPLRPHKRLS